jgi:4'-phosphopantetheinyl transferase
MDSTEALPLEPADVHLWAIDLDEPWDARLALRDTLSREEAVRAGRFRYPLHRQRYIAGRGLLRCLLGAYLGLDPAQVRFAFGTYGKPRLDPVCSPHGLQFNLSHAANAAIFAFCRGRSVGVDVEQVDPNVAWDSVAPRFFHAGEVAVLRRLLPPEQARTFFRFWTVKEAYLKARGWGLGANARLPDCSLLPNAPAWQIADPSDAAVWSGWEGEPRPGWAVALVVEGAAVVVPHVIQAGAG